MIGCVFFVKLWRFGRIIKLKRFFVIIVYVKRLFE